MSESLETRFWRFVTKGEGCWEWTGGTSGKDGRAKFGTMRAARVVWVLTYGAIPDGMWVLHECDNPKCVRPDHLFLGTRSDNMKDAYAKGRTSLQNGAMPKGETHHKAKLTEADVREIRERIRNGEAQKVLAQEKGVSQSTISCTARGVYWQGVE